MVGYSPAVVLHFHCIFDESGKMMLMLKQILIIVFFALLSSPLLAQQPTREELEKQRNELKKELEQIERLKQENANKTKGTYAEWKLANDKVVLQDRVIDNINKDIYLLDNNMYTIQRDINKYDRLLDTLKQEYAKSMVYAYRNRSNYDFINFIFSAKSFNDAIKRISYLKSYRNYRQMQGENILRTQELRRKRMEELSGVKEKKTVVLEDKSKEMNALEKQKLEKDRILAELKKKGKQLDNQFAAKNKQVKKLNSMITAAIDRATKAAIAKAKEDEIKRLAGMPKPVTNPVTNVGTSPKPLNSPTIKKPTVTNVSVLLNADNAALNTRFENRGLPWPVDKGYILMHFGLQELPSGTKYPSPGLTIGTEIGSTVKSVFEGEVSAVATMDNMQVVVLQHGRYFTTYSNLSSVSVRKGEHVSTGQVLGRVMANDEGVGSIDFIMSNEKNNFDPEQWLRRKGN